MNIKSWIAPAVAAVLVAGGAVGLGIVGSNVRADVEQSEAYAQDYSTATQESAESARAAADEAQEAADAAAEAVTAVAAQEAAAAAQLAADQAAAAAVEAERVAQESKAGGKPSGRTNNTNGGDAPTKCPAGSAPGQVDGDGNESLCAPTGPSGETCAEYDGPTCTSWTKP